jgi:hypothetical protein
MKWVRKVMIVVGNDDDLSEVILIPFDKPLGERSAREQKAFMEVCSLRRSVKRHWAEHVQSTYPEFRTVLAPAVTLMTVKRAPLKSFPRFPDLPVEIQYMILRFAYFRPRMLNIVYSKAHNGLSILNYRQPAVTHACHVGHDLQRKEQGLMVDNTDYYTNYSPDIDTVCLLFNRAPPRKFSKLNVSSIAIPFDWRGLQFTAADAKMFTGLEEIVLLVGRQRAGCNVELLPILELGPDAVKNKQATQLLDSQIDSAEESDRDLRQELELNPILELGADVVQD